jgi:digeranylgeranylglycerophospholipid reductase
MKYDLIVVGGGPGGLMAAKTAAEDGLKVLLIERKRNITKITRACSQIFSIRKLTPVVGGESEVGETERDGYINPVSVECERDKTRFHFPVPGFSLDYTGPLRPYLNWIELSPSGYQLNRYKLNDRPWGFYFNKETFVVGLLASVEKAGAEVWAETIGLGVENTPDGVRVRVRGKSGEQTLEARAAIAADGRESRIVESLGLNQKRQVLFPQRQSYLQYIMEGVETGLPDSSCLAWNIPSITSGFISMMMSAENRHMVGTLTIGELSPATVLEKFINDPKYAPMFRYARVVRKEAVILDTMRAPIREPVAGNVVIIGDAGAVVETWVQGAVASAYMAVKAIEKELKSQKGYREYIDWWQQAFAFNSAGYLELAVAVFPLNRLCSDDEMDYIFHLFQGRTGIVQMIVANNLELIKQGRPELYEKLMQSRKRVE